MSSDLAPLLSTDEAAVYMAARGYPASKRTLVQWRAEGRGPKSFQPHGPRCRVRYHRRELDAWLDAQIARHLR